MGGLSCRVRVDPGSSCAPICVSASRPEAFMPRTPSPILMFACSLWLGCGAAVMADPGEKPIEFNRDVRPILTENCFACHGPDKNKRKAKLRLDVREVALERE